ncbi:MAG TPA: hypothetical protein VD908_08285 [Cytophagales bacterium]|nr:hypothetical protein [Cytophagales bacterium]
MTKYKVNINRPKVSADEIGQNMDFNIVLKKYKREKHSALKINWLIIYIIILVVLLAAFFAVRVINDEENKGKEKKTEAGKVEMLDFE